MSVAFHAAWGSGDGPFSGEDCDFEGDWGSGVVLEEGEAAPGELCGAEVAREGAIVEVGGEGCAERRGGGRVEEEEGRDGEEDDEEEGGARDRERETGGDRLNKIKNESVNYS